MKKAIIKFITFLSSEDFEKFQENQKVQVLSVTMLPTTHESVYLSYCSVTYTEVEDVNPAEVLSAFTLVYKVLNDFRYRKTSANLKKVYDAMSNGIMGKESTIITPDNQ